MIKKALLRLRKKILFLNYLLIISFLFISNSCTESKSTNQKEELYIVCTTGMIWDAVKNIAKDRAKTEAIMGPGVDPHLYKATRNDLTMLREADIVFYNGLHLEGKMGEVMEKLGRQKAVIAVSEKIDKSRLHQLTGSSDAIDPHIWFDVNPWSEAVKHIRDKLMELDKKNKDFYSKNAEEYLKQLAELHEEVKKDIASIPSEIRVLITAHDAFGYFGKAYDIEVRGLQGISTVSEFGLKDISDLTNFIVSRKIKAVFVETSIPRKSLEAVVEGCQEKGHQVKIGGTLYSDAMGADDTPEGTYVGMVRANVRTITDALK